MAAFADIKEEWRLFKDDKPGERFDNHRERMTDGPAWKKVARGIAGFALIAVGIVFCILPGPGTVGIALGLALLAGMSKTIARALDHLEPKLRRTGRRARAFWDGLSIGARGAVIGIAAVVCAIAGGWLAPIVVSYLA